MTAMIESHPLQFPWTFTFFKKAANKGYEENTSTLGTTESVRPPLRFPWPRLAICQPRARLFPRLRPPLPPSPLPYFQVEDFWRLYVHLRRPVDDRPTVCDYHVFREGIKPMWEDESNVNGGKWIVRLKKGVAARYWEDLVRSHPAPRPTISSACADPHHSACAAAAPRAAGGAVQGGGRDLRGGALRALPGRHPLRLVRCSRSPEHTPSHQPPQALRPSGPLRPEHGPLHPLHPSAQGPAPVLVPTPAPRADRNKSADSRRVCMQIRTTLCSVLQLPMDASLEYKKHTDSMRDNSSYRNANSNFG